MFVVFQGSDRTKARRRLTACGIDLIEPADGEFAEPVWEIEASGVEVTDYVTDGRVLRSILGVGVRKNVLAVSVNPDLGAKLGYQPAAPQYLYPGHYGDVSVVLRTAEDADALGEVPWLVRLHVVPVTLLTND